jgi:short-subunit dehydrogenase
MTAPLVFITGASSGIGQALALRYAQAGWRLALVARRAAAIESWAAEQGLRPEQCQAFAADVTDTASMVAAAQACMQRMGVPQVVIANAGISVGMDTAELSDVAVMADTFATNNTGMAATFHPFVRAMCARGSGSLVGIASVAAIRGLPGHGAYCASKAAAVAYCESLRGELRPSGVRVVTLLPGYVATPLTAKNPYSMPFLLQAHEFADQAFHAIEAQTSYRVIPWQMGVVSKLLRLLPNPLFDHVMAGRARKPRATQLPSAAAPQPPESPPPA